MRTSSIDYEREAFCLQDTDNDTTLQRFETFIQDQAGATKVDKSPSSNDEITGNLTESVTENLSLRVNDEARVTAALVDASKKKKTGSVFSVEVDLSRGEMGMGVKALKNNILVISMMKRVNGAQGPGEKAGLRLGDIIFGANFRPCVEGSRSLLHSVKYSLRLSRKESGSSESESSEKSQPSGSSGKESSLRPVITLQCWRCHQLCSDPIPGRLFPRADDVFVQGYHLFRSRVLSEWERWNFNDILLGNLKKELTIRLEDEVKMIASLGANPRIRVIHNEVLDLERNILKAKGLRTALCVRIVHTKFKDDAVLYVLRVEDEESGLQWNVQKRYNDFHALHKELSGLSRYLSDLPFPKKRMQPRLSLRVIEERIVALERYIRQAVHRLTQYSTSDAQASLSLCKVQEFLDVEMFINCQKPPPLDDQRYLELMMYRRLNDFTSASCQQCIRFVDSVDLDALAQQDKSNGHLPMLELVAQALREVEQYALQQYGQQMNQLLKDRRPHMAAEKVRSFVVKCVRRQVEGAIYLPLRRAIFRVVYSFIADKAEKLQQAMKVLKRAPMKSFFEKGNFDELPLVKSLPVAVESFRNLVNAYLPSDQGNMLMKAAGAVMEVISEMETIKKEGRPPHCPPMPDDTPPSQSSRLSGLKDRHSVNVNAALTPARAIEMKLSHGLKDSPPFDKPRAQSLFSNSKKDSKTDPSSLNFESPHLFSSDDDLLDKSVLADPAGTMFSAAEHVLVERRDFDQDGVVGGARISDEDCEMFGGDSGRFVDEAGQNNDSFRELYSLLKTEEGSRDDQLKSDARKAMQKMAVASGAGNEVEQSAKKKYENSSHGSSSISDSVSDSSSDSVSDIGDPSPVSGRRSSNDYADCDSGSGLSLPLPSSIAQTVLSTPSLTAIRGTSVSRLERSLSDDPPTIFKPSEEKKDSYRSPLKYREKEGPSEVTGSVLTTPCRSEAIQPPEGTPGSCAASRGLKPAPVAVGADDFLPMFTYVLVQSGLPQLLLVKELMVTLVDNEEMYGECGYYMATLEAATQHIVQMAEEYSATQAQSRLVEKRGNKSIAQTPTQPSASTSANATFHESGHR